MQKFSMLTILLIFLWGNMFSLRAQSEGTFVNTGDYGSNLRALAFNAEETVLYVVTPSEIQFYDLLSPDLALLNRIELAGINVMASRENIAAVQHYSPDRQSYHISLVDLDAQTISQPSLITEMLTPNIKMAFSADGSRLALMDGETLRILDVPSGDVHFSWTADTAQDAGALAWSADGHYLGFIHANQFKVLDLNTQTFIYESTAPSVQSRDIILYAGGRFVVYSPDDSNFLIYDIPNQKEQVIGIPVSSIMEHFLIEFDDALTQMTIERGSRPRFTQVFPIPASIQDGFIEAGPLAIDSAGFFNAGLQASGDRFLASLVFMGQTPYEHLGYRLEVTDQTQEFPTRALPTVYTITLYSILYTTDTSATLQSSCGEYLVDFSTTPATPNFTAGCGDGGMDQEIILCGIATQRIDAVPNSAEGPFEPCIYNIREHFEFSPAVEELLNEATGEGFALSEHVNTLKWALFSTEHDYVVTTAEIGTVALWDVDSTDPENIRFVGVRLLTESFRPNTLTFNSDGTFLAVGTTRGDVYLYTTENGELLQHIDTLTSPVDLQFAGRDVLYTLGSGFPNYGDQRLIRWEYTGN